MTDSIRERRPHLILTNTASDEAFLSPRLAMAPPPRPRRDRATHGGMLLAQLQAIEPIAAEARAEQARLGLESGFGLTISFLGFPGLDLAFESLARDRSGIELLNVQEAEAGIVATVFVPDGKLSHFERIVRDYLADRKGSTGKAFDHKALVDTIQAIRTAAIRELWTDAESAFPADETEAIWWEVWLPVRRDRERTVDSFVRLARGLDLIVAEGQLDFPERTVLLVKGSAAEFARSIMALNSIAELRRAKETAEFFDAIAPGKQADWLEDLLQRTAYTPAAVDPPVVCLLDTGVNRGHPLIAPALDPADLHSVEPAWGTDDSSGHGTEMAGLALFGDLADALAIDGPLTIDHRLESVKLLRGDGDNAGTSRHHGYLTTEAVERPAVQAPFRRRVFSMAVTATDGRDQGRPSAWSAAIDRLAADADEAGRMPRLILVSAGNVNAPAAWAAYPDSSDTDAIHDPGQAWNALTVGACTELTTITETDAKGYHPIAPAGGLSPFSTTSMTWKGTWPLKPDIVFEGGNAALDSLSACTLPSVRLLTTHRDPIDRLFTTTNATSAATAQCARMAVQLMAAYPDLWPETIRALMVHSAEWTPTMRTQFLPANGQVNKSQMELIGGVN